ncbi:MAG: 1-deoxy-D-xylulose-5-phosphate synthase [Clostridia bacterium]|nr:1-deoxy-D-xylulose-5-phosphate synthase [Clostridia bacterium]
MAILDSVRCPADLRALDERELLPLAAELRETILRTAAQNGGHFASNLGTVELTVAIHRVFDTPEERVLFDVGHQAYAHKLLTGRADRFGTLRRRGGISGFTNRDESPYDTVTAGHSGSSLSVAAGIAESERLKGSGRWTVAVVGDGSFTNGMIYEALNAVAGTDLRLCIVLNDNSMSISKNVGGLSRHLSLIRTSTRYFSFKLHVKRFFSRVPGIGGGLVRGARAVRDFIKRTTGAETFFEKLGLEYIGPVDGHDLDRLIHVFEEAKTKATPVVVHCVTKKGCGYPDAEAHPERYHSVGPFDAETGIPDTPPKLSHTTFTRTAGEVLTDLAAADETVAAITAAMTDGCGLGDFASRFPDRFFDVGIAEEHAVALAGGLAIGGMRPFAVMYATFAQRVFDQMWHDVALQHAGVTLVESHAGLVPGDGVTHQGIYDAALFSRIPGIEIWSPDSEDALRDALLHAHERMAEGAPDAPRNPVIVRYPKGAACPAEGTWTARGTWRSADFGDPAAARRAVLLTYGRLRAQAVDAARLAVGDCPGWRITVLCLERIVPFPGPADGPEGEEFRGLVTHADRVLFAEEGIRSGGVGEALAASDWMKGKAVSVRAIGEEDAFVPHGTLEEVMRYVRLDGESLSAWIGEELT